MYKEMAADLGCPMPESGDLTSWAAQGVLLLNTTLTVRESTPRRRTPSWAGGCSPTMW